MMSQERRLEFLFFLCDAGETYALQPVFSKLDREQVSYKIAALGTAAKLIDQHPNSVDLGLDDQSKLLKMSRFDSLPSKVIQKIAQQFSPNILVTGMACATQREVAKAFQEKGTKVLGYYDPFLQIEEHHIGHTFFPFIPEMLVPAEAIRDRITREQPSIKIQALGNPTLEKWSTYRADISKVRHELGVESDQKLILYIGGYERSYQEALPQFLKASHALRSECIFIALHPKADGNFEQELLDKGKYWVDIIPENISTLEAVAAADLIVCSQSSVGVQALFMNKPVVYFDYPGSKYKNLAIENGWALFVTDPIDFLHAYDRIFDGKGETHHNFFQLAGIPDNSSELLAKYFQELAEQA